jgi:hypothetical protein
MTGKIAAAFGEVSWVPCASISIGHLAGNGRGEQGLQKNLTPGIVLLTIR